MLATITWSFHRWDVPVITARLFIRRESGKKLRVAQLSCTLPLCSLSSFLSLPLSLSNCLPLFLFRYLKGDYPLRPGREDRCDRVFVAHEMPMPRVSRTSSTVIADDSLTGYLSPFKRSRAVRRQTEEERGSIQKTYDSRGDLAAVAVRKRQVQGK